MTDLFATAAAPSKGAPRPILHSDTDLGLAVQKLGAWIWSAVPHVQRGMKSLLGDFLLYEAAELDGLVRLANRARGADKLPIFDEALVRLERVKYQLRAANAGGILPHKTYANSIEITDSIGKQLHALRNHFAPAPSPAT